MGSEELVGDELLLGVEVALGEEVAREQPFSSTSPFSISIGNVLGHMSRSSGTPSSSESIVAQLYGGT